MKERVKDLLKGTAVGRALLVVPRAGLAFRDARILPRVRAIGTWAIRSRELVDFTYQTTRESQLLLCALIADIRGKRTSEVVGYLDELWADRDLIDYVIKSNEACSDRWNVDWVFNPGRRIAFYLLVRTMKPRLVVEAGVHRGFGGLLISRALSRNAAEARPGDYVGIELSATKPVPLYENYPHKIGQIVRGDSTDVLTRMDRTIDLFCHETNPDPDHVRAQFAALTPRLAPDGVIVSAWTRRADIDYALANDLSLLTHQEDLTDHWYGGSTMACLFRRPTGEAQVSSAG